MLEFEFRLEENLLQLNYELLAGAYRHGPYQSFSVCDPKPRRIHKAIVRDRVIHQAIFRVLYLFFDRHFIFDSYSCRFGKGVHSGVSRLEQFARKVSDNYHLTAYALQCDIEKFFDSVSHRILRRLIKRVVPHEGILNLLDLVIGSFYTTPGYGLPLGNVTSQLFANICLNELDQFAKHQLREKYYLRYCDDFAILHHDCEHLARSIMPLALFLRRDLALHLHPRKVTIRKLRQGIDWLGYVALPHYRVIRTRTRRRIWRRLKRGKITRANLPSYLGMLRHCRGNRLSRNLYAKISFL